MVEPLSVGLGARGQERLVTARTVPPRQSSPIESRDQDEEKNDANHDVLAQRALAAFLARFLAMDVPRIAWLALRARAAMYFETACGMLGMSPIIEG